MYFYVFKEENYTPVNVPAEFLSAVLQLDI